MVPGALPTLLSLAPGWPASTEKKRVLHRAVAVTATAQKRSAFIKVADYIAEISGDSSVLTYCATLPCLTSFGPQRNNAPIDDSHRTFSQPSVVSVS